MPRITYIGAGSTGFGKRFIADILQRPALADGTLTLMDINQEALEVMAALAKKIARQLDVPTRIEATTDRSRAIEGADYVISTVLLHGLQARMVEHRIMQKYGVDQAVGCTSGPGGVFHALRYIPVMLDICKEMERLAPDGLFLHYANPTTIVPWALNVASKTRSIGLCHSVQGTAMQLAGYLDIPYEETGHWVAGVNHQAWFLRFEHKGQDLYPAFREAMQKPEIYAKDMVRFEMMKYFGYFITESSYHNSEYVPYFRKNQELIDALRPEGRTLGQPADLQRDVGGRAPRATAGGGLRGCAGADREDRVLRRDHGCDRDQRAVPLQRQRHEHRADHQPALLLCGSPLPGRQHGHPPVLRGRPAPAVRGAQPQPQRRRRAMRSGRPGGRPQEDRAGHCPGPADRGRLHFGSDPCHDGGDSSPPTSSTCPFSNPGQPTRSEASMTTDSAFPGQIPDTLDLVEHGKLSIRGILNSLNPDLHYETYLMGYFGINPPYLIQWPSTVSGVQTKFFEALPLLRQMTGSDDLRDIETGMVAAVDENLAIDGLLYDRALPERAWNAGVGYGLRGWNEDYANMAGNGRLLIGFIYNYLATGDEAWKQRGRRTAERMAELVIDKGDIAYYPNVGCGNDFSYPRLSGWVHTREPQATSEGAEGAMLFYHLQPVRGFAHWYQLTGDERFLALARKFTVLGMQPRWWGGFNDTEPLAGQQRGHFWGHWHAHSAAIRGVLDYGVVAGDYRAKQFARDAYEWGRMHGIHRLCVFPTSGEATEGCTLGDMTALAVALTDAGMGDYWDDVEQYARNGLIEGQLSDFAEMERVSLASRERPPQITLGRARRPALPGLWRCAAGTGDHRPRAGADGGRLRQPARRPHPELGRRRLLYGERRAGPLLGLGRNCAAELRDRACEYVAESSLALGGCLELAAA